MKLALVSSEYPPYHWGGVGSASHALANQLALRGHEVHVFTRRHSLPPVRNHEGISIHGVKWLKLPMAFALSFGTNAVPEVNKEGGFDAVVIFGNMTLLRERDYGAMKFPCLTKMCGTWAGERSALRFRDISLGSVSGANDLAVLKLSPRYDIYEDLALLLSDAVIVECGSEIGALNERMKDRPPRPAVPSRTKKRDAAPPSPGDREGEAAPGPTPSRGARDGQDAPRTGAKGALPRILDECLVRAGFLGARGNVFKQVQLPDMGAFSPALRDAELRSRYVSRDGRLLLFVGRLAARKNVMEAARIFRRYLEEHPSDSLLFIGKGNQEARLRALARKEGLTRKMQIVKDLSFTDLAAHYACADAFLFPSLWEGFGLVLLEALASGLPVVSRPVGGAPEVILEGKNGFLYSTEQEAVEKLGRCAALDRRWLSEDVRRRYDLKLNIDRVEAILRLLASEGKTRSLRD